MHRVVAHPSIAALVHDVRAASRLFQHDIERFHTLGRPREELVRRIEDAVRAVRDRVDAVCAHVAAIEGIDRQRAVAEGEGEVVVQRDVYVRVLMPGDRGMPFHIDRYTGQHAPSQRALWFPLVDIEGPEGLWMVDDDVTRAAWQRGPLSDQQAELRAQARCVPMKRGEVLLFGADTGHGSVTHALDKTRASLDLRICLAREAPRGPLGWRSRPLWRTGVLACHATGVLACHANATNKDTLSPF
jgi:hypothetical protein